MFALAPRAPARVQGRQQVLLVNFFQNAGHAGGQIGVEQNRAGVKILHAQAPLAAKDRFERHSLAVLKLKGRRLLDGGIDGTHAHIQAGHVKNAPQLGQTRQVGSTGRAVLWNQQQVARFRANLFDRRHGRLHRQGHHFLGQMLPAVRKQIGRYRRQLEAGIAHVDRAVKRRCVLHPFKTKPAFDGWHGIEHALLEFIDGSGKCGDEMWNHTVLGVILLGNSAWILGNLDPSLPALRRATHHFPAPRTSVMSSPRCRPGRGRETCRC